MSLHLTILHTNDMHARLDAMARLSTYAHAVRAELDAVRAAADPDHPLGHYLIQTADSWRIGTRLLDAASSAEAQCRRWSGEFRWLLGHAAIGPVAGPEPGAALTLVVTILASTVGERWSGLLAVFPVLGSVMAVFSQQTRGPAFTAALLRATATGMYSFSAFCLVSALTLPSMGLSGFVVGVAVSVAMLGVTRRLLARPVAKAQAQ